MNPQSQMNECPEDLIPTRKSLLGRLKDWQDNESWGDFFNSYWKLIYNFAVQRGLTHQEAEEVVQETVLAVAKSIPRFEYDPAKCAFKTWLLTVTRSKIANQFEKRARRPVVAGPADDSRSTPLLERVPDDRAQKQWEHPGDRAFLQSPIAGALPAAPRGRGPKHARARVLSSCPFIPAGAAS